jgi:hypothetical protein
MRVIAKVRLGEGVSGPQRKLDRREFVKSVTGMLTGVVVASVPFASILPTRAWAIDLTVLNDAEGATLTAMIKTICPHDGLDDAAYAMVVSAIDRGAATPSAMIDLKAGIASLGDGFSSATETVRVDRLKSIENSAFFQSTRVTTLLVLYSNPFAFAHFGYEGEAFSKGGYLTRGFNDLRWLPEVPIEASGPLPY